jgi:hypothetical protein
MHSIPMWALVSRVLSEMGIIIADESFGSRLYPVNPIPSPEYNILFAIQSLSTGNPSNISINTFARNSGNIIMTDFLPNFIKICIPLCLCIL